MLIHIDFDAFFSSLEELRNPELKGKPVIVCAFTKEGKSGVVMTANYEARKHGIKAGMPLYVAKQKLKDAYYIGGDKEYYEEISNRIMQFLSNFGEIEISSIDEAYIEVDKDWDEAYEYALKIKSETEKKFGIKLSIGIGKTIVNAKIASKLAKPNRIFKLKSIREIRDESISLIPGIGIKMEEKLNDLGIYKIGDLIEVVEKEREKLISSFGEKTVNFLFSVSQDKGREHVEEETKNSFGKIITLDNESDNAGVIESYLQRVIDLLYEEKLKGVVYDNIKVLVFFKGYETLQKSRKIKPSVGKEKLEKNAKEMLNEVFAELGGRKIRRIGVFANINREMKHSLLDYF